MKSKQHYKKKIFQNTHTQIHDFKVLIQSHVAVPIEQNMFCEC